MKLLSVTRARDLWKYLVAMGAGAIIFVLCHDLFVSLTFRQDIKVLTTSDDYQTQYEICSKLLSSPAYSFVAYGSLSMYVGEKPATEQAKLACLAAIEQSDHFTSIPLSINWATFDRSASVRLKALDLNERLLRRTYRGGLMFLSEKLLEEQDPDIQSRKLEMICRYLFLDKDEVISRFESEGPEKVISSILAQLDLLLPEGHVPPSFKEVFKRQGMDVKILE